MYKKKNLLSFLQIQKRPDYDAFWVTLLRDKHNNNVEVLNAVNFALFTHPLHTHTQNFFIVISLLYHLLTSVYYL